ncbi:hypothetical protein [Teichococcus rhizosphaerae]|nr:hypothetical protein [Pseudoroseomonas rhizosphaerae]
MNVATGREVKVKPIQRTVQSVGHPVRQVCEKIVVVLFPAHAEAPSKRF